MRPEIKARIISCSIISIALFNVAFHLAVAGNLEYHRDELLYFSLGMHPDTGYATVPPMIGLLAWLIQTLFGYSIYAVRILPALLSGIMIMMVARMAKELGGSDYAAVLASIGFTISAFGLRTFSLFMPVFIDVFFWTLCIYILIRYINSENNKYLLWFGIIAGLSLMNKYLIGVMFAGLLIIIPFSQLRAVFRNKMFWIGLAAGLLILLPNILWQISKGLPVIKHMSELNRTQLVHVNRLTFLKEQIMNPAWASVLTIEGIFFILIGKKAPKFRFLGFLVLFVVLTLMLLRGKSYYTQGLFPFLIAAGAASYDIRLKTRVARFLIPFMMVLLTIPLIPIAIPVMKSPGLVKYFSNIEKKYGLVIARTFEDNSIHSLPQDYADMIGWEQLTRVADSAWKMIEDKKAAFIYGENYGEASAITVIGKKYGLPEAVCFSESYRYWYPQEFNPDITSMVYINWKEPGADIKFLFRKITKIGGITNPDSREFGASVYLVQDPVDSFNKFWKERTKNLPWR